MATKKIKNLSVAIGKYTDSSGNEKTNWLNIGGIFQKDDGGKFMLMNRTFNPAGVPNPENRETFIVSMFDVKTDEQQNNPAGKVQNEFNGQSEKTDNPFADDDIPF